MASPGPGVSGQPVLGGHRPHVEGNDEERGRPHGLLPRDRQRHVGAVPGPGAPHGVHHPQVLPGVHRAVQADAGREAHRPRGQDGAARVGDRQDPRGLRAGGRPEGGADEGAGGGGGEVRGHRRVAGVRREGEARRRGAERSRRGGGGQDEQDRRGGGRLRRGVRGRSGGGQARRGRGPRGPGLPGQDQPHGAQVHGQAPRGRGDGGGGGDGAHGGPQEDPQGPQLGQF
mmetsp:Transcript_120631/g.210029  ORF Transcript_120631/g.210029 Transcript_120631/m.210029 type:complete len:229 (-) Transcript_120631:2558-3244(-)